MTKNKKIHVDEAWENPNIQEVGEVISSAMRKNKAFSLDAVKNYTDDQHQVVETLRNTFEFYNSNGEMSIEDDEEKCIRAYYIDDENRRINYIIHPKGTVVRMYTSDLEGKEINEEFELDAYIKE